MLRALVLALCLAFVPAGHAIAQVLLTPSEFREAAIAMMQAEMPDARFSVVDEYGVVVDRPGKEGDGAQLNLQSGYREYQGAPGELNEILARWARLASGPPLDARALERIVWIVRPLETVQGYGAVVAQSERPSPLVWRPFTGDLAIVLAFDSAEALEFITEASLSDIGVTAPQAWSAAPDNLPSRIGELEIGGVQAADRLAFVTGGNGLATSTLIDGGLCEAAGNYYYWVVDRNAFVMADAGDAVAERQLRDLMNDVRRDGPLYSTTPLMCRNGAMAAVTLTD